MLAPGECRIFSEYFLTIEKIVFLQKINGAFP